MKQFIAPTALAVLMLSLPGHSRPAAPRQESGQIPFEAGITYHYDYSADGKLIGYNSFHFEREEGRIRIVMETKIMQAEGTSVLTTDEEGNPLRYHQEFTVQAGTGKLEVAFEDGRVSVKAEPIGRPPVELEQAVGTDFYFFDNNSLPHWALFLPLLGLEPGGTKTVKVFHPQLVTVFPLTLEAGDLTEIEWAGGKVKVMPVTTTLSGKLLTFWLDEAHRLIREEEGSLRIVLVKPL